MDKIKKSKNKLGYQGHTEGLAVVQAYESFSVGGGEGI